MMHPLSSLPVRLWPWLLLGCALLLRVSPAAAQDATSKYGTTQRTAGTLIGILYDFKTEPEARAGPDGPPHL